MSDGDEGLPYAKGLLCNVEGCTDHHHVWDDDERLPCLICDPDAFVPQHFPSEHPEASL